jgi:hypothetical protein
VAELEIFASELTEEKDGDDIVTEVLAPAFVGISCLGRMSSLTDNHKTIAVSAIIAAPLNHALMKKVCSDLPVGTDTIFSYSVPGKNRYNLDCQSALNWRWIEINCVPE